MTITVEKAVEYFWNAVDQMEAETPNLDGVARKEEIFASVDQKLRELPEAIRDAVLASHHP